MALIDLASYNSLWRGYDYFDSKLVKNLTKINESEYESIVSGAKDYHVFISINHPRKSHCDCPHAEGRRIICKHMVATYFEIFPNEAKNLYEERLAYEEEEEQIAEEHYTNVKEYVDGLTEDEAKAILIEKLICEWYGDDYDIF